MAVQHTWVFGPPKTDGDYFLMWSQKKEPSLANGYRVPLEGEQIAWFCGGFGNPAGITHHMKISIPEVPKTALKPVSQVERQHIHDYMQDGISAHDVDRLIADHEAMCESLRRIWQRDFRHKVWGWSFEGVLADFCELHGLTEEQAEAWSVTAEPRST